MPAGGVAAAAAVAEAAPAAWASGMPSTRAVHAELGALSHHWQRGLLAARAEAAAAGVGVPTLVERLGRDGEGHWSGGGSSS